MLAKIRILLIAAALLCGSAASAQSFLDALVSGMIEGLAEGLTGSGTSAGQSQGQTNQSQVRTRDNIPPNSMVCTICNGTKRCPCKNGTISFTSSVTGRRLTIQCPNCLGTLQCAGCHGWGYVPLNTSGSTPNSSSSYPSGSGSSSGSHVCRLCNGTGMKVKEYYTGSATTGKRKWCDTCHKEVRFSHYHVRCDLCNGKGSY